MTMQSNKTMPSRRMGFCLTEVSCAKLFVGALGFAGLLWFAILAVL